MQYLGGKAWIGKDIASLICEISPPNASRYVDMFCGALNVTRHLPRPVLAVDACQPLICMWRAAQTGWCPPIELTEEQYAAIRANPNPNDPLTAFAMFGCSFGGKWGAGYGGRPRPKYRYPIAGAAKKVLEKSKACRDVQFECLDYRTWAPLPGEVIYADPPYRGTCAYAALGEFDSDEFWHIANEWAKTNLVFVSESTGPESWRVEKEWGAQAALGLTRTGKTRVERLFVKGPGAPR